MLNSPCQILIGHGTSYFVPLDEVPMKKNEVAPMKCMWGFPLYTGANKVAVIMIFTFQIEENVMAILTFERVLMF